ncbi:hypothetical protein ACQZ61_04045 [Agrobacterium vitis]|uniref:hypothetical protein n=1 Tax=Agrobacterium vitis TaxID=373 RepID=UPI001F15B51B|nr:hypothetical protein [Agrobacterium vitis]MCF1452305.1 hypothetical protein [Agrobacterium vitis]
MERSWIYRRATVFFTMAFCAGVILALLIGGQDTMLARDLAQGAYLLFGATVGAYVFGAEWSDRNKAKEILQGIDGYPPPPGGPV